MANALASDWGTGPVFHYEDRVGFNAVAVADYTNAIVEDLERSPTVMPFQKPFGQRLSGAGARKAFHKVAEKVAKLLSA